MNALTARRPAQRRAFTLLEVLIAGGVLFLVSAAVVGLSNSIIQGTAANATQTVTDSWASEGLELATTVRDNTVLQANNQNGESVWFSPVVDPSNYGWYELVASGSTYQLQKVAGVSNVLPLSSFNATIAETLTSQTLTAYRLICVEAVGAATVQTTTSISCNTDTNGGVIASDGDRTSLTSCDPRDTYCTDTEPSLNRNTIAGSTATIIPAGNAVKIRAVVVYPNKSSYGVSDLATLLTNWKGFEQTQND